MKRCEKSGERMSASSLRYQPKPDRNVRLREQISVRPVSAAPAAILASFSLHHFRFAANGDETVAEFSRSICASRGYPRIIRTDNAKEFTGKAMLTWGYEHGVKLRLIEPGKPNQNAYIESFNGRFRDACLNEHPESSPRPNPH